ncbi:hypothetical protein J6590_096220 [Homalodisca vitripennis]|nr:hypothetical protein J6590_096220 [Homalodisca vitripennis]
MFSPSLILVFLSISSIGERVAFYQRCVASADLTVDERKCARILIPARGSIVLSRSFSAGSRLAYSGTDTVAGGGPCQTEGCSHGLTSAIRSTVTRTIPSSHALSNYSYPRCRALFGRRSLIGRSFPLPYIHDPGHLLSTDRRGRDIHQYGRGHLTITTAQHGGICAFAVSRQSSTHLLRLVSVQYSPSVYCSISCSCIVCLICLHVYTCSPVVDGRSENGTSRTATVTVTVTAYSYPVPTVTVVGLSPHVYRATCCRST